MGYINGMIVQSDDSEPHVIYIMEALAKQFPYSIWKIGGQVDRRTWGGGFSFHKVGRACDIYLDAFDPVDWVLGNYLAQMFALNAVDLMVHHVIWNKYIYPTDTESTKPKLYKGSGGPHTDHVHVAFNKNPSKVMPYKIVTLCKEYHTMFVQSSGDASDRASGIYGTAFNPEKPKYRLSKKQRKKIMLENMGMLGAE